MEMPFTCFCSVTVPLEINLLKTHIQKCQTFQRESPFFREFSKIPKDQLQKRHLLAIKAEFLSYIDILDRCLGNYRDQVEYVPPPRRVSIVENSSDVISCIKCKRPISDYSQMIFLEECNHSFHKKCLIDQIQSEYVQKDGTVGCSQCKKVIRPIEIKNIKNILPKEIFDRMEQELIFKQFNIIQCEKCQQQFSFEQGKIDGLTLKDPITNQPLKKYQKFVHHYIREHITHYFENRFTCLNNACKTEQCRKCKVTPYHLGLTCEEYSNKKKQKVCRYCDTVIQNQVINQSPALQDICSSKECQDKVIFACEKFQACGHPCGGYRNESKCLPCLQQQCCMGDQKKDDYCNICWTEALQSGPCIESSCGHIFHYQCVMKRLEIQWLGPRMNFIFCLCPLCKSWMQFQPGSVIQNKMEGFREIFEEIKKKSLERLKYEGKDKDERLSKKNDDYFQKPQEYAMAIYCYYQCFKCKKPYFGGAKDCQRALENDNKPFDPKELICGNCCEIEAVEICQKHGKEYIEYKCRFCCQTAVWFCWGTTHFCEDCHKRQCAGDYVSKYTKDKLPKCLGKDKCPIGGDHKPNGDEQSLGCALCRNSKANQKNF